MRIVSVLMVAGLMALPANATKPTPDEPMPALAGAPLLVEDHTYRFGQTIQSEPGTTAEACAASCDLDARCMAWSLTPVAYDVAARCELKSNAGAATYRPGAVSGLTERLQMDPVRDAEMRYKVDVPKSRQPEAVPLDQLKPSPVPRVFGDPLPEPETDLLGGPATEISAVITPPSHIMETDGEPVRINISLQRSDAVMPGAN